MNSTIKFPDIDPVVFNIGPIAIRWYSLAYIIGIIFAYWYIAKIDKKQIFSKQVYESLIPWSVIGIIIGGRIGYASFYNIDFYLDSPLEIFKVWQGGMSFHGGAIGFIIAMTILCRKNKISLLSAMDLFVCAAPVGIFLGRIANFINGELYGRVTEMPWGIIFPDVDMLSRHPSQIYEAFFEGFLLFIVINLLLWFTNIRSYSGMLLSFATVWYGITRFFIEFYRQPDIDVGFVLKGLTMGQLLSFPMVVMGILIFIYSASNKNIKPKSS